MTTNIDELTAYLGAHIAAEVAAWAAMTDRVVRVPSEEWRQSGFTRARLAKLFITDPVYGTRSVVLKVLPPGEGAEAAAHRRAVREAPAPFRPHFVGQVFDSARMADGGTLTFQEPAGYSSEWRPMTELPTACVPAACEAVTRSLLSEWNHDLVVLSENVLEVLRGELADNAWVIGQLGQVAMVSSPWVSIDGVPVPNPFHLLGERSPLAGRAVDLAIGRVHGDLHGGNVLMRQRRELVEVETFILVDLMTYSSSGQLGRDIVRLLLCPAAPLLAGLSDSEREQLLRVFVRPGSAGPKEIRPEVVETVLAVDRAARAGLRKCGDEVWRIQYQLSLVTQGLALASFGNLGSALRCWFFRLAGQAAHELLTELGVSEAGETAVSPLCLDTPAGDRPAQAPVGPDVRIPVAAQRFR